MKVLPFHFKSTNISFFFLSSNVLEHRLGGVNDTSQRDSNV